jgi:ABC-type nitrate/sulfonate/bicarbonate transport system substrate-binding protein
MTSPGGAKDRRRSLVWAVTVAAAVLLFSLVLIGAHRWPFDRAASKEPVRLALSSTPHAALLHIAAAKGFFDDEGLAVTVVPVSHGKAALDLLGRGEVDMAAAAEVPFVIAVLQGQPLGIAASMLSVSTEMAVVARGDNGIAQPRDLLGKKIGVTRGTSGEYFLWAFLIRHQLASESVTLVDLPPDRIADELSRGTIDAASTWQPVRLGAETALGARAVSFTAPVAYTVTHVVVARNDYWQTHPGVARKLVRALLKAEQFNRAEPEQALAIMAQRLKLDAHVLRHSWEDLGFRVNLLQSQLVTLEEEARWAMERNHARQGPVPNFLSHLYLDALLREQPERVTVVH